MKAPITAAQAMPHPTVVETINTLSQMADDLRTERDALQSQLDDYTVMMTAKCDALQARINELAQGEPQAHGEAIRRKELGLWGESGAEQWDGLKDIVSRMIRATPPASAQAGYKLVPVEPTPAMAVAGDAVWVDCTKVSDCIGTVSIYRAMLAAAPGATK